MIFIEGCSFSTYWAGLHNFLDFHGKATLVCALTNLFNFPMIFMSVFGTSVFVIMARVSQLSSGLALTCSWTYFYGQSFSDFLMIFICCV